MQLYDLCTGGRLASCAMLNPQTSIAADVIGRISARHAALGGNPLFNDRYMEAMMFE